MPRLSSRPIRSLRTAVLVQVLVLLGAAAVPTPGAAAASRGLPLEECRLTAPQGLGAVAARCGYLEVPENPAAAEPRIALHVAVVPALNRRAAPDPLFVLAGGPGQAASDLYASYAAAFAGIARDRDIVLVDQRGTGRSAPLACEYPADPDGGAVDPQALREATRQCLVNLKQDPRYFTTSVAVADLERVRAALGAEQINLYAVSYGTRVAQHYLRRHPQRVRTMTLDGAVPPGVKLGPDMALDAQRAFDAILERCRNDDRCAARFPQLTESLAALRERLARPATATLAHPVTGTTETMEFGIEHLNAVIRLLSYSDATAALLPLLIDVAAQSGQLAPLAAQYLLIERAIDSQFAYGMHNAVVCTEDLPLIEPDAVDRQALAATYLGTAPLDGLEALCSAWPSGVLDDDLHDALATMTPVLVLSGAVDPVTPVRYGEQVAAQFPRGRHLVVPGQGHGQLAAPCMPALIARFIRTGAADGLDAGCLAQVRAAPFLLDFAGPAP